MKNLFTLIIIVIFTLNSLSVFAQPSNDDCNNAIDLGTLDAPANCPDGTGAVTTWSLSNTDATAENPYTYISTCNPLGDLAADVWYMVEVTGNAMNIDMSGSLSSPIINIYTGTCGSLVAKDCFNGANNGSLSEITSNVSPGEVIYLQISGDDETTFGDFDLSLSNDNSCDACILSDELSVDPMPINGTYQAGETVTFCYHINEYSMENTNWLHGIVPDFGAAWDISTLTVSPPGTCGSLGGSWDWFTNVGSAHEDGFFFDLDDDGGVEDNYGDNCEGDIHNNEWNFCWDITTLPLASCVEGGDLGIDIFNYADGETGSWTDIACQGDPTYSFIAMLICCENPIMFSTGTCFGFTDGTATALGQGTAPYDYVWEDATGSTVFTENNVNGSSTATNLAGGTYTVTVTDDNGCQRIHDVEVEEYGEMTIALDSTDVLCYGQNSGTVTAVVTGGQPQYDYTWSNGATQNNSNSTTSSIISLLADVYSVTVIDDNGCEVIGSIEVIQPDEISVVLDSTDETCHGANDGTIEITVSNGVPNYDYSCTGESNVNNQTSPYTYSGLADGNYTVTVTDDNACSVIETIVINQGFIVTAGFTYGGNQCQIEPANIFPFVNTGTVGADSYIWNFDDGNTGSGTTVNHPFDDFGSYDVSLTVTQGICVDVETIEVTVYDNPVADTILTHVSCAGFADGIATISTTGGSGVYNYTWSDGAPNNATNTDLSIGTYDVIVADTYGCQDTIDFIITEPNSLFLDATRTNASCFDDCDGTANVDVTGGSGSYDYLWSVTGETTSSISGLCNDTYTVTVTDQNSTSTCFMTAVVTVDEPLAMILTTSFTNSTCGNSNGTATVLVSNGTPDFTYNFTWATGNDNLTISDDSVTVENLPSGAVTLVVTDSSGCSISDVININDDGGPTTAITAFTNIACNGDNTGDATVTIVGGSADFTYTWDGGTSITSSSITNQATGLAAGLHTIVVVDASNCSSSSTITLTEPNALNSSTSQTNPNCGQNNGSATVSIFGGNTPYEYQWDAAAASQTNASALNLTAGMYIVTVTDANLCEIIDTVTLVDLSGIDSLTFVSTDVLCYNGNTGTAIVTAHGGTPSYEYLWTDGQTAATATGLSEGTTFVTVTDLNLCQSIASIYIGEPTELTASISSFTDALCYNESSGTATVQGVGGTIAADYTYLWSPGAQTDSIAIALAYGIYNVELKDDNNCTATASVSIDHPQPVIVSIDDIVDANCGNADGAATVGVSGGTSPYTYSWSGGSAPTDEATINGLSSAGSPYTVIVTDSLGCQNTKDVSVSDIAAGTATITNIVDVSCFGNCDGTATVSSTGTPPFTYNWDTAPLQDSITAIDLCFGTYNVTVTDVNNCNMFATVDIAESAPMTLSFDVEDPACFGECVGIITANISGGTTPYSYQWNDANLSITQEIDNLCEGEYILTASDANNCTVIDTAYIVYPLPIVLSATSIGANCNQNDGSIDLSVSPVSTYDFLWSNAAITEDLDTVVAGVYYVLVTNSKDCTADITITIDNSDAPIATISDYGDVDCFGNANGFATVSVTGSFGPYTYEWNTTPTTTASPTAVGLSGGSYVVSVTDDVTGCIATASIDIAEPTMLDFNLFTQDVLCFDDCNAWARVVPFGGTSPYTYEWFSGDNQADSLNTGLCAGDFDVIITDQHGCDTLYNINITQPTHLALLMSDVDALCNLSHDGSASVDVTGGTTPYSYLWDSNAGNQSTQTVSGLGTGTYCVTVTDAFGCVDTLCADVDSPDLIEITMAYSEITNLTCYGECEGAVSPVVSGGTPGYLYVWSNDETTSDISDLCAGGYTLSITDAHGCTAQQDAVVSQPPNLVVNLDVTDELCYGYCNGEIQANVSGGIPNTYQYLWSNDFSNNTSLADSLCPGEYILTVEDGNGCTKIVSEIVDGPNQIRLIISDVTDATCDTANGSATVVPEGGTAGFSILWDVAADSATTFSVYNLAAGTYTVVLSDYNDCFADTTVSINNFGAPTITGISTTDVLCFENCDGTASISYIGGTDPITVQWDDSTGNQTGVIASNLCEGQYSFEVSDANNCIASDFVIITQPDELQVVVNASSDVTCFGGNNASATANVIGGTIENDYSYLWTNNDTLIYADSLEVGDYSVLVIDDNNCEATASVTINQPLVLEIILDGITDVDCFGNATGSITVHGEGGQELGYDYNWFSGDSPNSPVNGSLLAGDYQVMLTDQQDPACTIMESYTVTQPDRLVVYASAIDATCNETNENGTVYVSNVEGGTMPVLTYQWSPGTSTTDTMHYVHSGSYIVQIWDTNGCPADTFTYVSHTEPPIIQTPITEDVTCYGLLNGQVIIPVRYGTQPYTYTWSPNNGTSSNLNDSTLQIINMMEDNYSITVTDVDGCTDNTVFQIYEPEELQVIPFGPTDPICIGQQATISVAVNSGTPPYTYEWDSGDLTNSFNVSPVITTDYIVSVTDANGCFATPGPIRVNVYQAIEASVAIDDNEICYGDSIQIFAGHTGGTAPYTYTWNNIGITAPGPIEVVPNALGYVAYSLTVTDFCGSPNTPASDTVYVLANPEISLYADLESGCAPITVEFSNLLHELEYSYNWDFGDYMSGTDNFSNASSPSHDYDTPDTYDISLTVTDNNGCRTEFAYTDMIEVHPNPTALFWADPMTVDVMNADINFYDQSELVLVAATDDVIDTWVWQFGDNGVSDNQNPTHTYEYPDTFDVRLVVKTNHGCVDTTYGEILVQQIHTFYVPDAISLESPSKENRSFYPSGIGIDFEEYNLSIYDRWGELMWETDVFYDVNLNPDIDGMWDGTFQGTDRFVELGVYVWYVRLKDINNNAYEYSGTVTVIR